MYRVFDGVIARLCTSIPELILSKNDSLQKSRNLNPTLANRPRSRHITVGGNAMISHVIGLLD